jgi:multisubunit Na+/H+ antiporter MnhB subunit
VKWVALLSTTVIVAIIILFEWPKMKQNPKIDKRAFISLLLIGLVMSMFNLPQVTGPSKWIEALFKPFGEFMEK